MRNNDFDIHLLLKDPNTLIEEHQKTIACVVNKFVYTGLFSYHDRDEVIQYVNERLLTEKITKMQKQYKPQYYVVTYLSKIVYNLCLEYSRKHRTGNREDTTVDISQTDIPDNDDFSRHIMIQEESRRLDSILKMYYKHHKRIEVFLKIFFGIGITHDDLLQLYPEADEKEISVVLQKCNPTSDIDHKTDKELYETLTQFINKYEKKHNSSDALRKWVHAKMTEIIVLLNGNPKTANYDKETLKILFQFKYENLHFKASE